MRVLVTGGAGYVGTELVRALAAREDITAITIYDNLARKHHGLFISERLPDQKVRFVLADILDTRRLKQEVTLADTVYHLAARVTSPFGEDDPHRYEQVNHWGTAELSYALEAGPAQRVVYLSSTSVYGAGAETADETTAPNPSTQYGWSKRRGERMLERLADQLEVCVLRCGNIYGYSPAMRFDSVVNRFMFDAHFTGRITINGSGQQRRPFLHVGNATRALIAAGRGEIPAGTYNLVDRNKSILELARTVEALYPGLEALFITQDLKLRNLEVRPDRRLTALGFGPRMPLATELEELRGRFSFSPASQRPV